VLTQAIMLHPTGIEQGDRDNPVIMAKLHAARETAGARLRALVASNVKLTAGTDSMHGLFPFELQTLVRWGMSPVDALRAGTIRAAECCRVETEVGTLEPGKRADLITFAGNPLEDIADIERTRIVVKNGIRQDRLLWEPPV
jgi:imidazolonepropionase-like amidohydrolase